MASQKFIETKLNKHYLPKNKNRGENVSLSDRNSRLVLVITLLSTLTFLITMVLTYVKNNYAEFYIGDVFPIGVEHVFSNALITNLILVFSIALFYCYFEAQTYCNYPEERLNKYIGKANFFYQRLLISIKLSFITSLILFILLIQFPILNSSTVIFFGIVVIVIIIIISLSYINWNNKLMDKLFSKVKLLTQSRIEIEIIYYWFLILMSFSIVIVLVGIQSNLNGEVTVEFSSKTGEMEIIYSDKTIDMMPSEVIYRINGNEKKVSQSDFMAAGSNIVFTENRKVFFKEYNITKQLYNGVNVLYKANVDLKDQLNEGRNDIEISFVINDLISDNEGKKRYTIWNSITKQGDNLEVTKEKFSFKIN